MKSYPNETYIMEFAKSEIRLLENILRKVKESELNDEEEKLLNDIDLTVDSILHP